MSVHIKKNYDNFVCRKADHSHSKCILTTSFEPVYHKGINEFEFVFVHVASFVRLYVQTSVV